MQSGKIVEEKVQASKSPFQMIYDAAKEQNQKKLETALLLASCDIEESKAITPVTKLASEDDINSVEFLIKFGGGNRLHAILGYALNGHFIKAHLSLGKVYEETSSRIKRLGINGLSDGLNAFAAGLGMGGHLTKALDLLNNLRNECNIEYAYTLLGEGLLQGKHYEKLNQLVTILKNEFPSLAQNITMHLKMTELIQQKNMSAFYNSMVDACKKSDNPHLVMRLLNNFAEIFSNHNPSLEEYKSLLATLKSGFPEHFSEILAIAFDYYTQFKHIDVALNFFDDLGFLYPTEFSSIVPDLVCMVAARSHNKNTHEFLASATHAYPKQADALLLSAIDGLYRGGCYKEIYPIFEKLYLTKTLDDYTAPILNEALLEILKINHLADKNLILKTIAMTDDLEFLISMLDEAQLKLPFDLIEQGKKIGEIMNREKLSYAQVVAMSTPEIRMFLLLSRQLVDRKTSCSLSRDTFLKIANFLAPLTLSRSELYKLDKIALKFFKTPKAPAPLTHENPKISHESTSLERRK